MIDATALDSADAGSWHWKMDVTTYDFNGKNPVPGTIEVWCSDGNMRTVMTVGNAQQTTLRVGDRLYRSGEDSPNFSRLEAAFMQVLNPIPNGLLNPSVKLKLDGRQAGKTKLDCVQATLPFPPGREIYTADLGFCGVAGTGEFVAAYEANETSITRGQVGTFRSKQVPVTFRISSNGHMEVEGKTTIMSSFSPGPEEFAVTPELHPLQLPIQTAYEIYFLMLSHEMPTFPAAARSGDGGTVKFDVLIGEDGRISSHTMVQSASAELDRASEEYLTHIVFRPYLINGLPVQVKWSTSMDYHMLIPPSAR